MTYKFVGVLRSLTDDKPYQRTAIWVGVGIGFATEFLRKFIKSRERTASSSPASRTGFATDFVLDAVVLPSPYASSFGGFVNLATSAWFAAGGVIASLGNTLAEAQADQATALPEDMSTTSLLGGGLIAGDALAALGPRHRRTARDPARLTRCRAPLRRPARARPENATRKALRPLRALIRNSLRGPGLTIAA